VIPEGNSMVSLLGSGDELLRVIENAISADFHVRGNEITVSGSAAETTLASRLFEELTEVVASGAELTPDSVEHSISMLRRKTGARPRCSIWTSCPTGAGPSGRRR
jgi:phosphate starvation-inducible protein PhoH and related proteins